MSAHARWRFFAPPMIALLLIPGVHAGTSPTPFPGANVSVGGSYQVACKGTLKYEFDNMGVRGALLELGPFRVLPFSYVRTQVTVMWGYYCEARQTLFAHAWGGVLRNVRLEHDADGDGTWETVSQCNYDGVSRPGCWTPDFVVSGSAGDSGVAAKDSYVPKKVNVCVGAWVRGVNEQAPLEGVIFTVKEARFRNACATVSIAYSSGYDSTDDRNHALRIMAENM